MRASESRPARPARPQDRTTFVLGAALLVVATAFFACDINHPIVLWDEARGVSSGVEMARTGLNIVVTYDFKPDVWSTKPPLLIWLIAACVRVFGASNWSVRIPSLLAAIGTLALVMGFTWRLTYSRWVTLGAGAMLALSEGFFGPHAAWGADYEALLTLFTTGYLLVLFTLVHQRRPAPWRIGLFCLLVLGACLTKGVAGVLPGVGAFVYVVVRGRWPRLFKTPWYALAGVVVTVVMLGYYLMRERAAPGYLVALNESELGGHYLQIQPGAGQPVTYYPMMLYLCFAFGPLLLILFVAPFLAWPKVKSTAFLTYGAFVCAGLLAVLTGGKSKLFWYLVPLYPILSIMLAIIAARLLSLLPVRPGRPVQLAQLMVAVVAIFTVFTAVVQKAVDMPRYADTPQTRYGQVFDQLNRAGLRRIRTLDSGVPNSNNRIGYDPLLRFYTLVWRGRGLDIGPADPARPAASAQDAVVVTCDPHLLGAVRALGPVLPTVAGCAVATPGRAPTT